MEQSISTAAALGLVVTPPMSRRRVLQVASAGFGMVVAFVMLAAYLGYRGSNRIQDTAQELIRQHLVQDKRGAEVEAAIVGETQETIDQLIWVLGLCFLIAAATAGMTVWIIHRGFAMLEFQSSELARVSWHLIDSHEKLARRFSHEMHDELGQSLSGLRRMLGRISGVENERIREESISVVDDVLQNVRKLSQVLRPVLLDDFGLDSGLRWLCDRFTQRTQIPVAYASNFNNRLSEGEETQLFRIAQEALTNIARHSGATEASVAMNVEGNQVKLEILDNGRGLKVVRDEKATSLGMVGMRARARQLKGELIVENRKEGGLRVVAEVPLQQVSPNAEQDDSSFVG